MISRPFLMTVVGRDRPGIIAKVTEMLYRYQCNLEDVTMTILEGEFAMMFVVRWPQGREKVEAILKQFAKNSQLTVYCKSLESSKLMPGKKRKNLKRFVISAFGRDRTGIVYHMSQVLAKMKLNIVNLDSKIFGPQTNKCYALTLEVDIAKNVNYLKLKQQFQKLGKKLKIEILIKPSELLEC